MPNTPTETAGWELPAWQLPLAQLCDSAAPTGAFSHSYGLETYADAGMVSDGRSFVRWLRAMIRGPLTTGDGYAIRLITEGTGTAGGEDIVGRVDRMLHAQMIPRQSREAAVAMGKRTLDIARVVAPSARLETYADAIGAGDCHGHPAVPVALVGTDLGAPVECTVGAYLQGVATSLTQNAVRLIPLGQNAGQLALAEIRGDIVAAVKRVPHLAHEEFGASLPGLEIAQMRHERIRARMYMS